MRIQRRGLQFDRITYHARVTQCLGSLTVEPWYLVVAEPTGSVQQPPGPEDLHAFRVGTVCSSQTTQLIKFANCRERGSTASEPSLAAMQIPHGKFVRLHAGTWHAGPLFDAADDMVSLRQMQSHPSAVEPSHRL